MNFLWFFLLNIKFSWLRALVGKVPDDQSVNFYWVSKEQDYSAPFPLKIVKDSNSRMIIPKRASFLLEGEGVIASQIETATLPL